MRLSVDLEGRYIGYKVSMYVLRAGRHFYGKENEIWAGSGPE